MTDEAIKETNEDAKNIPVPMGEGTPTTSEDPEGVYLSTEIAAEERISGMRIEAAMDDDGWHWMLFSENGRAVATNVRPYKTKFALKTGVTAIKRMIREATIYMRMD